MRYLDDQYSSDTICPDKKLIFRAFKETPYNDLKVVIIGQDPYHDGESACGLAFGNHVESERPKSPSLRRILGQSPSISTKSDLSMWARQGVLLLNSALTVKKKTPGSHLVWWKPFTEGVIKVLNENNAGLIFLLWGSKAQVYKDLIDENLHHIIIAEHPAAGVYAGRKEWESNDCFNKVNDILLRNNGPAFLINW